MIRDAAPDSWGMQVILRRVAGTRALDTNELPLLRYLTESGSDRIGALDLQASATDFVPRDRRGSLDELVRAGDRFARGLAFSPELDDALTYGTSIGGARPKALLTDTSAGTTRHLIAKFSVSTDTFPWVQAEAVGMELARRCGVTVPTTTLTRAADRDVLLVERFDRPRTGTRRFVRSGLTLLGLHELAAHHGTYVELAERIRLRFTNPAATLRDLFTRIVVNVLIGNTDDHARNVAAFWDGDHLEMTPAYDLCPQPRSTGEASQAMAYGPDGARAARLVDVAAAAGTYLLSAGAGAAIVERCRAVVHEQFGDVCDNLGVDEQTRALLWGRSVANPSIDDV